MPGRRINRTQVAKCMEHRKELEQGAAAAKAGVGVAFGAADRARGRLADETGGAEMADASGSAERWWSSDIAPLLEAAPALNAVTILEELQRRYPEEVSPALLRTLQRRLRQWRASHGVEREL
jgi:hypothetical protein